MGAVLEAPAHALGPLAGKIGIVLGIANTHSIAAGCARHFAKGGATLVATYLNETAKPYVDAVTQTLPCAICGRPKLHARDAAGIVLGATVPIILTSRADTTRTRLASCAVSAILAAPIVTGQG